MPDAEPGAARTEAYLLVSRDHTLLQPATGAELWPPIFDQTLMGLTCNIADITKIVN
jgi:hypothetical protein